MESFPGVCQSEIHQFPWLKNSQPANFPILSSPQPTFYSAFSLQLPFPALPPSPSALFSVTQPVALSSYLFLWGSKNVADKITNTPKANKQIK